MPAKFDRCVKAVKAKGSDVNPYAVCHASLAKKKRKTARQRRASRLRKLHALAVRTHSIAPLARKTKP